METCYNHPEREALSFCHNCKTYYCEECLVEGKEFYFCKKSECLKVLQLEINPEGLPKDIVCPNCGSELELSDEEWERGKIHCPECEAAVDFSSGNPKILYPQNYVELLSTLNQANVSLVISLLDNAGIDYHVYGQNFLTVRPGIEPARFFVNENQIEEAREIFKDVDLNVWGFSSERYED